MKKISVILFLMTIKCNILLSQLPVITMTTSKPVGYVIEIGLIANKPKVNIQIDFGDG
jgi:hypothetical protein